MSVGIVLKLMFFLLWPVILLYLYYLSDKERFRARMKKLKEEGFFK